MKAISKKLESIKNFSKDEKGSGLILFALGLTVFLGISATVLDAGLLYVTRSNLKNAVDAAALAGAQELPYNRNNAIALASIYGGSNGLESQQTTIEVLENNTVIKVESQREVKFFFAGIIGHQTGRVTETAIAQVAPLVGVGGAVPLGIEEEQFQLGREYTLKVGAGDSAEGWFGALALAKTGSSSYEESLKHGFKDMIRIGDILDVETGNMSNPTKRAIDFRIAHPESSQYCTITNFDRNCRRLLKVPVIEFVNHRQVKVLGFAMFLVDQVTGQGNDSYITGKFVRTITSGEIEYGGNDFGLYGVKLTR